MLLEFRLSLPLENSDRSEYEGNSEVLVTFYFFIYVAVIHRSSV